MLHLNLLNLSTLGNALIKGFSNTYLLTTYIYYTVFDLSGTGSHFPSLSYTIRRIRWPFNWTTSVMKKEFFALFCLFIYFVDAFVLFEAYRDVYLTRSLVCLSHCAMVRHFCPCFFFVIVCVISSTLISRRRSPFIIVTHFQWQREGERECGRGRGRIGSLLFFGSLPAIAASFPH